MGDWVSAPATVADFVAKAWTAVPIVLVRLVRGARAAPAARSAARADDDGRHPAGGAVHRAGVRRGAAGGVAGMVTPWTVAEPLNDAAYAHLRRRAIFECDKWDPQVGDANVVARSPLVLREAAWAEVSRLAEALARETLAAEAELALRPDLQARLALPRPVRRALRRIAHVGAPAQGARIIRFDFHHTDDGWRISEANTDVPGGLNEASGFARLMAPHYPWAASDRRSRRRVLRGAARGRRTGPGDRARACDGLQRRHADDVVPCAPADGRRREGAPRQPRAHRLARRARALWRPRGGAARSTSSCASFRPSGCRCCRDSLAGRISSRARRPRSQTPRRRF